MKEGRLAVICVCRGQESGVEEHFDARQTYSFAEGKARRRVLDGRLDPIHSLYRGEDCAKLPFGGLACG